MASLPEYHVLSFFYDQDGGCALTVLANGERYHITVNAKELRDRSTAGKKIRQGYQRLLRQVQAEASGEEAADQTVPLFVQEDEADSPDDPDSGVDIGSETASSNGSEDNNEHEATPSKNLQRWILKPIAPHLSSKQKGPPKRSLEDWYHCLTHFYYLTISSGKLSAVRDNPSESLDQRIDDLIPTIKLPGYIQNLNVPSFAASQVTVLAEDEGPAELPIHPTLVEHNGQQYFLKAVNNAEPGPTKREIQVMKKIEQEGLHNELRVPLLRGLVHFDGDSPGTKMLGFLLDAIKEPIPLTKMLDPNVAEEKRNKWAKESARMIDVLHQHNIIWGDAKGDNFMVDRDENLWIIDFGGSYTEGWVDPELKDTEEGDDQGIRRLVNGLKDPERNTIGGEEEMEEAADEEEDAHEAAPKQHKVDHPSSLKRRHQISADEEQSEAVDRAAKQQKGSEDSVDEARMPFEVGETARGEIDEGGRQDDETKYCYCNGPGSGKMIACDGEDCQREWFHFKCVGIDEAPEEKKWYCDDCRRK